ncbi:MAG: tetratricopeptide repeat protein [Sphingobium sp.]
MSVLLALLVASASGMDPETEAVMGRRKPPAERRIKPYPKASPPVIDPALEDCANLAQRDSAAAIKRARDWIVRTDGPAPRQCLGLAEAQAGRWAEAATAFRDGARLAGTDGGTAARLWAQAGNAALAGGDMPGALSALDKALTGNALPNGLERGEAYLDRARARVAQKDEAGARADLDSAIGMAPQDPLVWLLSATLARRMDDLPLAKQHISQAVRLAGDDASVLLEQGVIAALGHDDATARTAFRTAARIGAGTPVADKASAYLAQLGDEPVAAPAPNDKPQSR